MIITTTVSELTKAIKAIRHVMKKKRYLPILACCLLSVTDESITLSGTDLEYAVCVPLKTDGLCTAQGKAAIPFGLLAELVKGLPLQQSVTLAIDGLKMTITSGSFKGVIKLLDAEEYPVIEGKQPPPEKIKKQKEKFEGGGILRTYVFEARHGEARYYPQEGKNGEWRGRWWYEILGFEQVCNFELEADDLSPMISKIEANWHSLPVQSVRAYEIVGYVKKQYKMVPSEPGQWKRSTTHSWQVVEQFSY